MATATPKLTLYVDIVSPFAYLAYYVTRHSPIFQRCEITYIPIYLGGLMHACNNRPPLEIKNKDKWISSERLRWAKLFNIPTTPTVPAGFPFPTLQVQRVLAFIQLHHPTSLSSALDALYTAFWVDANDPHITTPAGFGPVLEKALGKEVAQKAIQESQGEQAKRKLTENTERAFQSGAFGLPWFECVNGRGEREGFWGFDHLGVVVRFLGLDDGGREVKTGLVEGMRAML